MFVRVGLVQEFLDVGVSIVVRVLWAVGAVVRIELVRSLPGIGHAVPVSIRRWGRGFQLGPPAHLLGRIDHAVAERGCAGLDLAHNACVLGIAVRLAGTHVTQDQGVCLFCGLGRHGHGRERCAPTALGLGRVVFEVDPSLPVVSRDLGRPLHHIALDEPEGRVPVRAPCVVNARDALAHTGVRGRARLVVVVDHIDLHGFAVAGPVSPVVDD